MPKIEFKGKTYQKEKARSSEKNESSTTSLTDVVEMPPQLKEIYERAQEKVEEKLASS